MPLHSCSPGLTYLTADKGLVLLDDKVVHLGQCGDTQVVHVLGQVCSHSNIPKATAAC
jgi:hypothetical protein